MDEKLREAIRTIGLALNATHNTVTTDLVDAEPDENSWRIDHSKEIRLLEQIEAELFSTDTDL